MKLALLITFLTIVTSCTPTTQVTGDATTGSVKSATAPYMWPSNVFPLDLRVSAAFSNDELNNITGMASSWETALEGKDFYRHTQRATELDRANLTLKMFEDSVMGVYKIQHWPLELPSSALAVTSILGVRYNQGDSDEYVKMTHADILVNYNLYNFRTDDSAPNGTYDLQTVILHEQGHFLGLAHQPYGTDSVMIPSIGTSKVARSPTSIDIYDISDRYNITLSSGGSGSSQKLMAKKFIPKLGDTGTPMRMLIELYPNGECIHRENGVVIQRHSVK